MTADSTRRAGTVDLSDAPARDAGDVVVRRAAELLRGHRESIDRLDAILVFTLAERFKHTQAVGALKAAHDLPPSDAVRESVQIARLERLAADADLDPAFAKKFLSFIISEVIRHHESHLENGARPHSGTAEQP
jgi:chorismate mutase